jgi:hypothetical protein
VKPRCRAERNVLGDLVEARRARVDVLLFELVAVSGERQLESSYLEENDAERVLIGAPVDRVGLNRLRGHIGQRAPPLERSAPRDLTDIFGDAEVADLDLPAVVEDVCGLEVAMDDLLVDSLHRCHELPV